MKRWIIGFVLLLWAVVAAADLTPAQKTTLLAAINADGAIKAIYDTGNDTQTAQALNVVATPTVTAWDPQAPVKRIIDNVVWSRYTQNDAPDGTQLYNNRGMAIQIKQQNLTMILNRASLDAGLVNLRDGIRDATTSIPAGAGGANVHPGGANCSTVCPAMTRSALRIEAILAAPQQASDTTGSTTARVLVWEGPIAPGDIASLR